jgi:hypothetical protein
MKLHELFVQAEYPEPKFLSDSEFAALSKPTPSNIEDRYKVGDVAFDNKDGLGAVPNNQSVSYFGFVAEMSPSTFLSLVTQADRSEDASRLQQLIKKKAALGAPFLTVKINESEWLAGEPLRVRVTGHEGRGRMVAIKQLQGDAPVPVHFFVQGGVRARDLSEKFFLALRKNGIIPEGKDLLIKVKLADIFWSGKKL